MEYKIGIEMRDEYKSMEVAKGAMKLVRDIMLVQPDENVVVNIDTATDKRVANAIINAAYTIGAKPVLIQHPIQKEAFTQPTAPVAAAVAKADVWIELAYNTIMHSDCFRDAMDFGTRYTCLTGMDAEMMVKTISNIDVDLVIEFGEYLCEVLRNTNEVIVRSKNGTLLKAYNCGRFIKHAGQKALIPGNSTMLSGQVSWCPIEETIEGTIVFDGALFPPACIGLLKENIILMMKEGRITAIEGGLQAKLFKEWLASWNDPNMYRLAHYSMGFNPGVTKPTGRIVEDERVFGGIEFGFGTQVSSLQGAGWNASAHTDGTVLYPTLIFDGKLFEKDGFYQDLKAREYSKRLGIVGY
jgi:leucyl aminopeptidase (aminopeptidase T)